MNPFVYHISCIITFLHVMLFTFSSEFLVLLDIRQPPIHISQRVRLDSIRNLFILLHKVTHCISCSAMHKVICHTSFSFSSRAELCVVQFCSSGTARRCTGHSYWLPSITCCWFLQKGTDKFVPFRCVKM